jgi:excisionase family DNA binding protein
MLAVVGINAATILGWVANGQLHGSSTDRATVGLKTLLFGQGQIRARLEAIKNERGWVGRTELASKLNVSVETLKGLIAVGQLTPVITVGNVQYFDRDAVNTFANRYITAREASSLLGVRENTIHVWRRAGRLQAVSGPDVDGRTLYRYDRLKLIEWRQSRITFGEAMELLGVSKATLHRWVEQGKLTPLDDMGGKQRWFARVDVEELRNVRARMVLLSPGSRTKTC